MNGFCFTLEDIKAIIESEPEYPTPWDPEIEKRLREAGATYQDAAATAVRLTKKELIKTFESLCKP